MGFKTAIFGLFLFAAASPVAAETWHVDAVHGDDGNDGISPATAWRSLKKLNDHLLMPGDKVLLAPGSVWAEPLIVRRSGTAASRIEIGAAPGPGARPRIDAGGVAENAIEIANAEYISISGLEVTNSAPSRAIRRGVLIAADDFGVAHDIRVSDLYVHDIAGISESRKDNGGIVFRASGARVPSRFEGLTIERNIIWKADRSGISGISDLYSRERWFPSRFVVIRDNYLEDIGGDAIVPRSTDGTLIEHNIVRGAAARAPGYNAAVWQWSTDNTLIQLNDAGDTKGVYDGQGFDSDYNSRNTTFLYNYSHDNAGGFLLLSSPVKRDDAVNLGNIGTLARFNVSRNDRLRIFQLAGGSDALIESNVIHVAPDSDVQMVVATIWDGWSSNIVFRDNRFLVAGSVRYGHENGRKGGEYLIAPGLTPVAGISFQRNHFHGTHVDAPEDGDGVWRRRYRAPDRDWKVPTFDPARPEGFDAFLKDHRQWMMRMLARELGHRPVLQRPRLMGPADARRK